MGRILDLINKLERKFNKPADPDLLLSDEGDTPESSETDESRKAKVRRQRRAKTTRWGNR